MLAWAASNGETPTAARDAPSFCSPLPTAAPEPRVSTGKTETENPKLRVVCITGGSDTGKQKTRLTVLRRSPMTQSPVSAAHRVRSQPSGPPALNSPPAEGSPGPESNHPTVTLTAKHSPSLVPLCLSQQKLRGKSFLSRAEKRKASVSHAAKKRLTASVCGLAHHRYFSI